ncbi:hypothetical protein MAR_007363, partial [Mya arenaria]
MSGGYCTNCPDKCFWEQHANTPYIFYFTTVIEKKTYSTIKAKYEEASEQLLELMGQELEDMIDVIEDMMIVVRNCNARLAEIVLQPNPLTMVDHIDLMIENEKMHRKDGWLNRVRTLQSFRKAPSFTMMLRRFTGKRIPSAFMINEIIATESLYSSAFVMYST